jgi:hypothetical protein
MDYNFNHAQHLSIPDEFLPLIGLVMVQHAYLDRELKSALCRVAGLDQNAGISILSHLQSTSARASVFKNLADTKIADENLRIKIGILTDVVKKLCTDRNTIAHVTPYFWSPTDGSLGYLRDGVFTNPQLVVAPPFVATLNSLSELANRIQLAATWLHMLTPMWADDATDPHATRSHHPNWNDDSKFPWQDELAKKLNKGKALAGKR